MNNSMHSKGWKFAIAFADLCDLYDLPYYEISKNANVLRTQR